MKLTNSIGQRRLSVNSKFRVINVYDSWFYFQDTSTKLSQIPLIFVSFSNLKYWNADVFLFHLVSSVKKSSRIIIRRYLSNLVKFKMAVSQGMRLGFSLHLRAEEAIAKFEKGIEDDFNYLHEILAEAKRHFGR